MSTTTTKTIDEALLEVRYLLNDSGVAGSPFRFSNDQVIRVLNTALRELYAIRPDAFIGNFVQGILSNNAVVTYTSADLGLSPNTPFPVDDRLFYAPVVNYCAGRLELADDEFTDNNRAMTLLMSFRQQLGVKG